MTIFGTRPEVIKLFPLLDQLKSDERFRSVVVCTSQHREMIEDLLQLFGIKPDHDLKVITENQSLVDISTRCLAGLDPLLKQIRPDMVLVQGDTTTAFIGALAAFYHKIPIGHVEAGLRSFNKMHPYPEEVNRRLISLVADIHFAPTNQNARNLHKEGVEPAKVCVTGNTVIDTLLHTAKKKRETLSSYLPTETLNSKRMILVTAHRRESWGAPLEGLCHALRDLVSAFSDVQIVYPVHLNPNVRKTVFAILRNVERIKLLDPLPYQAFVEAMVQSYLIITDSGGIQEEAPTFGKPTLVFRKVTERPEGLAMGGVKLVGLDREVLIREASRLLADPMAYKNMTPRFNPYGDGQASQRISKAILHYFDLGEAPEAFNPEQSK